MASGENTVEMTHDDELAIVPRAHAKQIVHAAPATDPRLEVVRAKLRREAFLFPGPRQLMRFPTVCLVSARPALTVRPALAAHDHRSPAFGCRAVHRLDYAGAVGRMVCLRKYRTRRGRFYLCERWSLGLRRPCGGILNYYLVPDSVDGLARQVRIASDEKPLEMIKADRPGPSALP
jgi:hypothetical protein